LEPIEKPSKYSRNSSASSALDGTSHIMMIFRPFSPRFRPFSASTSFTALGFATVRTNGIMILTLVQAHLVAHALHRLALQSKHGRKLGSM
jgi:hypothetical protein